MAGEPRGSSGGGKRSKSAGGSHPNPADRKAAFPPAKTIRALVCSMASLRTRVADKFHNVAENPLALHRSAPIIAPIWFTPMKTNTPQTWLAALCVGLIAACFVTVTGWLLASPSEEIT